MARRRVWDYWINLPGGHQWRLLGARDATLGVVWLEADANGHRYTASAYCDGPDNKCLNAPQTYDTLAEAKAWVELSVAHR